MQDETLCFAGREGVSKMATNANARSDAGKQELARRFGGRDSDKGGLARRFGGMDSTKGATARQVGRPDHGKNPRLDALKRRAGGK